MGLWVAQPLYLKFLLMSLPGGILLNSEQHREAEFDVTGSEGHALRYFFLTILVFESKLLGSALVTLDTNLAIGTRHSLVLIQFSLLLNFNSATI